MTYAYVRSREMKASIKEARKSMAAYYRRLRREGCRRQALLTMKHLKAAEKRMAKQAADDIFRW